MHHRGANKQETSVNKITLQAPVGGVRFCTIHQTPLVLMGDLLTGRDIWACLECDLDKNYGNGSVLNQTRIPSKDSSTILRFVKPLDNSELPQGRIDLLWPSRSTDQYRLQQILARVLRFFRRKSEPMSPAITQHDRRARARVIPFKPRTQVSTKGTSPLERRNS